MTLQPSNPSLALLCLSLCSPLLLAACRSPAVEPPPPAASYELAAAPPGARGARAAGTDAAPPRPGEGLLGQPGTEEEDEAEPETDAGADPDAGAVISDAGTGVAL